jgi:accessory colonization factor AcfC
LCSNEVSVSTANITISQPGQPKNLQITDLGNNSFSIQCEKGTGGTNNSSVGVDIYYTTDGTSPLNGNSIKSNAVKYEGGTVNITQDTTINAVARTVGAHP